MSDKIEHITANITKVDQEIANLQIQLEILKAELQIANLEVVIQGRRKALAESIVASILSEDERCGRVLAVKQYRVHTGVTLKEAAVEVNKMMKDPKNHFAVEEVGFY